MIRIRRRGVLALSAFILAACTPATDAGGTITTGDTASPPATVDVPLGDAATLVRGLDGDSFRVEVDGSDDEVRLIGINAPEGSECYGDEARRLLLDLIEGVPLTMVRGGPDDRDGFGRRLSLVYAGGVLVNAELVRRGAALAYHDDLAISPDLLASADAAWAARIGMWNPAACPPTAPGGATISEVVFDAPGRDEENPNGEYVVVTNGAATTIDLAGWGLRDETSSNRYRFPEGARLDPGVSVLVRTGCGTDTTDDLYWCNGGPVWSNGGDTAILTDPSGNVADRVAYP